MSDYYYLDVSLEVIPAEKEKVSAVYFKNHVMQSMKILFGERQHTGQESQNHAGFATPSRVVYIHDTKSVGASITVDVLKYDIENQRAILRCPSEFYVKLHSSLTLRGDYGGSSCVYKVHQTSPFLLSLLSNSRTYRHV